MLVLQVTYDLLNQILLLFHKLANYTPQLKSWIEVTWGFLQGLNPLLSTWLSKNPDKMLFDWHQQNPEWGQLSIESYLLIFINPAPLIIPSLLTSSDFPRRRNNKWNIWKIKERIVL